MKTVIISAVCGVLSALLFNLGYSYLHVRPIAVVDINQLINQQLNTELSGVVNEQAMATRAGELASLIEPLLLQVATEERVTLLVAPAVVSGVPDYTDYLSEKIKDELNGERGSK